MHSDLYNDFILTHKNKFSSTEVIKRGIKAVSLSLSKDWIHFSKLIYYKNKQSFVAEYTVILKHFSDLKDVKGFQGDSCVGNMVWLEPCVCQEGSGAEVWSCLFLQLILTTTCCDGVAQSIHTYKQSQTHLQTAATAAVSKKEKSGVCFYHAGIHLYCCSIQQLLAFETW